MEKELEKIKNREIKLSAIMPAIGITIVIVSIVTEFMAWAILPMSLLFSIIITYIHIKDDRKEQKIIRLRNALYEFTKQNNLHENAMIFAKRAELKYAPDCYLINLEKINNEFVLYFEDRNQEVHCITLSLKQVLKLI